MEDLTSEKAQVPGVRKFRIQFYRNIEYCALPGFPLLALGDPGSEESVFSGVFLHLSVA